MSINIACSAPDCTNPVIGQCTGYKKTCGKYYCREHSTDTLCFDCSNQKAADEEAEKIYNEYLALAEKVSKESIPGPVPVFTLQEFLENHKTLARNGGISSAIGIALFILALITRTSNGLPPIGDGEVFSVLVWFVGVPVFIAILKWNSDTSKLIEAQRERASFELVSKIEIEKKGFSEFWTAWLQQRKEEKTEKSKQALMGVLAVVGAIAVGAIASSLSESEYDRTRRAVRDEMNRN